MRRYRAILFGGMCAAICGTIGLCQTQPSAAAALRNGLPSGGALISSPMAGEGGSVLLVDDDGAQCPGALRTIQEAVRLAGEGATILVCPGTYRKQVSIVGAAKTGLKLIGLGREDEVVLEGDHTEAHGIHLQEVTNVVVRGFTIREFGSKRTTASDFGWGSGLFLENADYNIIEHNRVSKSDLGGIILSASGNNVIRHNFIFETDHTGFGCGIYLEGRKSANNIIFQNHVQRESGAGIHLGGAGTGNVILNNSSNNNGHAGILHEYTDGTWIEGNRLSYNEGAWGVSPYGKSRSRGIELIQSNKVTVFDNTVRSNTAFDISWDKVGDIVFMNNACDTANQPGLCGK